MLNVVMLSVVMLSVILLNVILLSVILLNAVMLYVYFAECRMLSVAAPHRQFDQMMGE
jgi:hypothetical protein